MEDFRKPFEYTEEKKGFILLFVFMLIVVDIYQAFIYIMPAYNNLWQTPAIRTGYIYISIIYIVSIPLTAFVCFKLNKHMLTISKVYLLFRSIVLISSITIIFIFNVNFSSKVAFGSLYTSLLQVIFINLILPIAFVLVFSVGWFIYFIKSKSCREFQQRQIK